MQTMGEALVGRVAETIAKHGTNRVLVVGCRGDNFPPRYRDHPQLVFWETEGRSPGGLADRVPADVKLVLVTRFVGHPVYNALADVCAKRNVVFGVKLFGTGELKSLLRPFVNGDNPVQETLMETAVMETEPETMKTPTGTKTPTLKDFVTQHANLHALPLAREAERVWKLAEAAGIKTTEGSIKNTIYVIRTALGLAPLRPAPIPKAAKAIPAPKKSTVAKPVAPSVSLDDDDQNIIRMLDDMTAAVAVVKEEIIKRSEKRRQFKELLKSL